MGMRYTLLLTHMHTHTGKHLIYVLWTCSYVHGREYAQAHRPTASTSMLYNKIKEETATWRLEIMTSTFIRKTPIIQPVQSLSSPWSKQSYSLQRCLYSDLTLEKEGELPWLSHISLGLRGRDLLLEAHTLPCTSHSWWVHGRQMESWGWRHKPMTKESLKPQLVSLHR